MKLGRELTIDEQVLELISEWRKEAVYYTNVTDPVKRETTLVYLNALMDEYNDKLLPELVLLGEYYGD